MNNLETDILIIGGGPAAMVTAMTAVINNMDKRVMVVRSFEKSQVPCGIPYVFGETLGSVEKNAMVCGGNNPIVEKIERIVDTVTDVNIENKIVTARENIIKFDKLIFATGSVPFVHENFQSALNLENVFTVNKEYSKVEELKNYLPNRKKIIVGGTGFIGVEIATKLATGGKRCDLWSGEEMYWADSL